MKKKLILMTLALAGLCFTSQAQNGQKRKAKKDGNRVNRVDSIAKKYGLTEIQKTNFKTAIVTKRKSLKSIKAQNLDDKKIIRTKRKAVLNSFDSSVKTIFSPSQYQQFTADKSAKKQASKEKHLVKRVNRMADSMKLKYGLSTEQHTQIKTAMTTSIQKRAEINKRFKDTDNKEARKAEMKEARKKLNTEMQGILSAEQYAKFKADRKAKKKTKKKK